MLGIVFTLLTGVTWCFVGVVLAGAPKDSRKLFSFFFLNSVVFLTVMLIYTFGFRRIFPENWKELMVLMALIFPIALNNMFSFYLLKRAMECGPKSIAWSIMQFGFTGSFLLSILVLGEKPTCMNIIGLIFINISIALFAISMSRKVENIEDFKPRRFYFLLLIAFLSNSLGHFLYMLPNHSFFNLSAKTLEFRAVLLPIPQLLWIIPILHVHATFSDMRSIAGRAVIYGLVVMTGQILFFHALDAMTKSRHIGLTSPLAVGSCILFFFFYRIISRKERADFPICLGLAAGIIGIFLISKLRVI